LKHFAHSFFHQALQLLRTFTLLAQLFVAQSAAHGLLSTHSVVVLIH
jgi:hypothetical protein